MNKVYYYEDELNDDFAKVKFNSKKLDPEYEYIPHNVFRRIFDFLLFHGIAKPIGFIYTKIILGERIVNRKVLKPFKGKGYFIYGNHTRGAADAFTPGFVCLPNKDYIITNNDSASNCFLKFLTKSLGSLPLPDSIKGYKNFTKAVKDRIEKGHPIVIYPEAHIWPYYTKIRPFIDTSFRYPLDLNVPIFTFTVTYQKRRFFKKPKSTVYVDGPFYPKEGLSKKENQKYLRDEAYNAMVERSKNSTYEYNKFIKKEKSCID